MNFKFGISEIMFYDATSTQIIENLKNEKYKNDMRLTIKPYKISFDDICSNSTSSSFSKIRDLLKSNCEIFFNAEFKDYIGGRQKHEQITSNDCVTNLKRSHEFIAYYDLDEFIFPRSQNITFERLVKCDDKKKLCSVNPFEMRKVDNKASFLYNYLDSLIENNRENRDRNMLSTISFNHVAYLISDNQIDKLFKDLRNITKSNYSSNDFPVIVYVGDDSIKLHKFIIEEQDLSHVKYLYDSYSFFSKCLIKSINITLNNLYRRYVYLITEHDQRWPKCVYYHKNIHSVFVHYPVDVNPGSWRFSPSTKEGHFLSHFRNEISYFNINYNMSITRLNIDFEYLLFMTKTTNYCKDQSIYLTGRVTNQNVFD